MKESIGRWKFPFHIASTCSFFFNSRPNLLPIWREHNRSICNRPETNEFNRFRTRALCYVNRRKPPFSKVPFVKRLRVVELVDFDSENWIIILFYLQENRVSIYFNRLWVLRNAFSATNISLMAWFTGTCGDKNDEKIEGISFRCVMCVYIHVWISILSRVEKNFFLLKR